MSYTQSTLRRATEWFEGRAKSTTSIGERAMLHLATIAIREKLEREYPIPLTYEELLQLDGEMVWLEVIDSRDECVPDKSQWVQVCIPEWKQWVWYWLFGNESELDPEPNNYGKTHIAYRHKPMEEVKT